MTFEDLFGEDDEPTAYPYRRRTPKQQKPAPRSLVETMTAAKGGDLKLGIKDAHEIAAGVSIAWLSKIFRVNQEKCKEALANCPVKGTGHNGGNLYDVKTAATFLVEPAGDMESFLSTMTAERLPAKLQEKFWDAKTKELRYRAAAGELYHIEDVREVFVTTFSTIKNVLKLWPDLLQKQLKFDDHERVRIIAMVDGLLDEVYESLHGQAANNETQSWLKTLE